MKRLGMAMWLAVASSATLAATLRDYVIVQPESPSEAEALVIRDFNALLAKSLGSELKVVAPGEAPNANRIFMGMAPAGAKLEKLASQEFVTMVEPNGDIRLFGGGANGMRYAAYDYLETTLGYRFYDWRGGMKVPDLKAYEPKPMVRRHRFSFEVRGMSTYWHFTGPEWALFCLRNAYNDGLNTLLEREKLGTAVDEIHKPRPNNSSLPSYLPRNRKAPHTIKWINDILGDQDLEVTHPEYFSMNADGSRNFAGQRCLSNPGCRALLKKLVFEQLARETKPSLVDISAADVPGRFCNCPDCLALEKKYGSNAGPIIDVFLEFCPEAERLYPQHRLMTLVYRKAQTQHPPKSLTKMPDNFVPDFAPIDDDFSKDWLSPQNADTAADLKTWGQMCKAGILMWYYPNPYGGEITPPFGNIERLVNDIRFMHAAGTRFAGFEHNVGLETMTGFTELQTFLMVHLFKDLDCDWRALMDEFLAFEYGKAAPGVKAYLAKLEELRKAMTNRIPWDASRYLGNFPYLTPERLVRWDEAFDRLEAITADDRRAQRNVQRLRTNLDFVLVKKHAEVLAAQPAWGKDFESVLKRFRTELKQIGEDCYSARNQGQFQRVSKAIEDELFILTLQNRKDAKPLPAEIFGKIPENKLVTAVASGCDGGKVDDPDAAYGVAFAFKGVWKPEAMSLPFVGNVETINPMVTWQPKIGRGVDEGNLGPQGKYKFYYLGEATITPNCYVELNSYHFRAYLNAAYEEGSFNRVKIYASLKFEGPKFYPGDTLENRVLCDRVVVVKP